MATQQTKHETQDIRQERAAEFWSQRIASGQAQQPATQQQTQEAGQRFIMQSKP